MAARDEDEAAHMETGRGDRCRGWRVEWERHCYNIALEDRFKEAGPAEVLRMFKGGG